MGEHAPSHSRGGDVDPAAGAPGHDLGVTGHDAGTRLRRGVCRGLHDASKLIQGEAFLDDEAQRQAQGPGPAHGEVIAGAEHGEPAHVAARKERGIHDVAIRRDEDVGTGICRACIGQLEVGFRSESGVDHALDQLPGEGPAASVLESNQLPAAHRLILSITEPRRAGAFRGHHAGAHGIVRRAAPAEKTTPGRFDLARDHLRAQAARRLVIRGFRKVQLFLRIESRQPRPQAQAAALDASKPPPDVGSRHQVLPHQVQGFRVPARPDCPGIGVLDLVRSRLDLPKRHVDAQEHVQGLESGDDAREAALLAEESIRVRADDSRHVPRENERIHCGIRLRKEVAKRRDDRAKCRVEEQVVDPSRPGGEQRGEHGGDRRFEADGEKHDGPGSGCREIGQLRRGVDQLDPSRTRK